MSKIDVDQRLPVPGQSQSQYEKDLAYRLNQAFRAIAQQLNSLSEGSQVAFYTAMTSAPTVGAWAQGDFVMNSAPAELGTAGSKYIIHGWRCMVSGTPGTFVQCRYLTGN
jgi:hypothetical protein